MSTAPATRRIPDGRLHAALRSTRIIPRRAVRRGAAWPPAERPSSCLAVQAVSRAGRWPHRRAVMAAERGGCRHSNTVRRPSGVVVPGYPDAHRGLVALSASFVSVRVASVRPSGVRRPVRVQRPRVRCPLVRCPVPGARCPVPGVRCPVRASGIRASASVSTLFAPVSPWCVDAAAAIRLGTGRIGNLLTRGSLPPD
jgi:hypothetical protein